MVKTFASDNEKYRPGHLLANAKHKPTQSRRYKTTGFVKNYEYRSFRYNKIGGKAGRRIATCHHRLFLRHPERKHPMTNIFSIFSSNLPIDTSAHPNRTCAMVATSF